MTAIGLWKATSSASQGTGCRYPVAEADTCVAARQTVDTSWCLSQFRGFPRQLFTGDEPIPRAVTMAERQRSDTTCG